MEFSRCHKWFTGVWVELHTDTRDYNIDCSKRNSPQNAPSLVCWSCTPDWHAFHVSDDTVQTAGTRKHLTQPFHCLVQDLSVCTGIEVSAGFHGSSAGLQHGRERRRRVILVCCFQSFVFFSPSQICFFRAADTFPKFWTSYTECLNTFKCSSDCNTQNM